MFESPIETKQETFKFKDYFDKSDIVVLAEGDAHGKHHEEIMAFIEQFKDTITTLFVEWSVTIQKSVDRYIETGEVDDVFNRTFEGATSEGKNLKKGTLEMLDLAKKYGIEVICYDASKLKSDKYPRKAGGFGYWYLRNECRDEDMFVNVKEHYEKSKGKCLIIIGGHHMTDENFEGDYKNFGRRMRDEYKDNCKLLKLTENDVEPEDIYDEAIIKFNSNTAPSLKV